MKKNIAVVGCGYWGKNLLRNFFKLEKLYSIYDSNPEITKFYSNEYKVKQSSFTEIKNDKNIKGVVLAVPAHLHASMAIEVINSGKHVLVEKPLAMNEKDANEMISAAKKNGVQLMVGHLLQYHPVFKEIKKIIKSGEIGDLKYIYSSRLSFGKIRTEEDIIWSFAPHDISMILSLANEEPTFVTAEGASMLQKNIADSASIHLEFDSGLKSNISVSWLHPFKESKLVVIGKSGMLIFDDNKPWKEKLSIIKYKLLIHENSNHLSRSDFKYLDVDEEEPLKKECQHFIEVVDKNIKPLTDGDEGLKVLKVLSAASKSKNKKTSVRDL